MDSLKIEWKPISVDSFKSDIQNIFTSVSESTCDISQKIKEFFSLMNEEDGTKLQSILSWYQIYDESLSNSAFIKEYHTLCENIFIFTYYSLLVNSKLYFAEHLSTPPFFMKYMDQYKSLLSKYNIESDPLESYIESVDDSKFIFKVIMSENNKIDYVCLLSIENDVSHYLPVVLITKINNNIYMNNNENEQMSISGDVDKIVEILSKELENTHISWNKLYPNKDMKEISQIIFNEFTKSI